MKLHGDERGWTEDAGYHQPDGISVYRGGRGGGGERERGGGEREIKGRY